MTENRRLKNHLLIAMPTLADPNFSHSVTYLCEHTEEGALGLVINRPSDLSLGDVFEQMEIDVHDARAAAEPVLIGGPVEPHRGFVLHSPEKRWQHTEQITDEISLTSSRDVLEAIAAGEGPAHRIVAVGYAGWGAGQLDQEILDNSWLSTPATMELVFETAMERRWEAAAAALGVDLSLLSEYAGRA